MEQKGSFASGVRASGVGYSAARSAVPRFAATHSGVAALGVPPPKDYDTNTGSKTSFAQAVTAHPVNYSVMRSVVPKDFDTGAVGSAAAMGGGFTGNEHDTNTAHKREFANNVSRLPMNYSVMRSVVPKDFDTGAVGSAAAMGGGFTGNGAEYDTNTGSKKAFAEAVAEHPVNYSVMRSAVPKGFDPAHVGSAELMGGGFTGGEHDTNTAHKRNFADNVSRLPMHYSIMQSAWPRTTKGMRLAYGNGEAESSGETSTASMPRGIRLAAMADEVDAAEESRGGVATVARVAERREAELLEAAVTHTWEGDATRRAVLRKLAQCGVRGITALREALHAIPAWEGRLGKAAMEHLHPEWARLRGRPSQLNQLILDKPTNGRMFKSATLERLAQHIAASRWHAEGRERGRDQRWVSRRRPATAGAAPRQEPLRLASPRPGFATTVTDSAVCYSLMSSTTKRFKDAKVAEHRASDW